MESFQALRSPAIPFTSFHDLLVLLISSSVALRHGLVGLLQCGYLTIVNSGCVFFVRYEYIYSNQLFNTVDSYAMFYASFSLRGNVLHVLQLQLEVTNCSDTPVNSSCSWIWPIVLTLQAIPAAVGYGQLL